MFSEEVIRTVEQSHQSILKFAKVKSTDNTNTIYSMLPEHGKGFVSISNNTDNFFYSRISYTLIKENFYWHNISEKYIIIMICENKSIAKAQWNGEEHTHPQGVSFQVNLGLDIKSYAYSPPGYIADGYSIILRENFIRQMIEPFVKEHFSDNVELFNLLSKAGNVSLPVLSKILVSMRDCTYNGIAYENMLHAKALEIIATLMDAILNLDKSDIHYISEFEREAIQAAQNILQSNIKNPPTVRALAKQVGINPNQLQLGFRLLNGVTVMEYLRNYRIEKSLDLLKTDLNLSLIAEQVGYKSASRFAETFHKIHGMKPRAYRKMYIVK